MRKGILLVLLAAVAFWIVTVASPAMVSDSKAQMVEEYETAQAITGSEQAEENLQTQKANVALRANTVAQVADWSFSSDSVANVVNTIPANLHSGIVQVADDSTVKILSADLVDVYSYS